MIEQEEESSAVVPMPDADNMADIAAKMATATPLAKDHIAHCVVKEGWVTRLLDCFTRAEAASARDVLVAIFQVVKGLFLLNDVAVFERILADEIILAMIAALEYDPDLPPGSSNHRHRNFLNKYNTLMTMMYVVSAAIITICL